MTPPAPENFWTKPRKEYELEAMLFMWLSVVYLFIVHWFLGIVAFIGVSIYWLYDKIRERT